jgi:hypothetical protein
MLEYSRLYEKGRKLRTCQARMHANLQFLFTFGSARETKDFKAERDYIAEYRRIFDALFKVPTLQRVQSRLFS